MFKFAPTVFVPISKNDPSKLALLPSRMRFSTERVAPLNTLMIGPALPL